MNTETTVDKDLLIGQLRNELEEKERELIEQKEKSRLAGEELRKKNFMLESLIDLNPYSITMFNKEGYPIRENRANIEMFKVSQHRNVSIFEMKGLVNEKDEKFFKHWWEGETVIIPEKWLNIHDNYPEVPDNPVCTKTTAFSIKNEEGEIENYVLMHEDITARKTAEMELQKAHDELIILNEDLERKVIIRTYELEEANEELEKKNGELEDFAFRVSHKLKNSLLILKRILEMKTDCIEDVHKNIGMFIDESDQLMAFVENLLQLARAGKVIDDKQELNLDTLIRGTFTLHKKELPEAQFTIRSPLPSIKGDLRSLEQVFVNFFRNSFEHRDPDKDKLIIEIDSREEQDNVIITYRDNGEGILPENLNKVFEVSYSSKGRKKYGFGMTINKKIIEAHGGSVSVNSEGENMGVEFEITLPVE